MFVANAGPTPTYPGQSQQEEIPTVKSQVTRFEVHCQSALVGIH
jgi:hypothetical protein